MLLRVGHGSRGSQVPTGGRIGCLATLWRLGTVFLCPHAEAWAEPVPTLLRGDDFPPPRRGDSVLPDHTKPFQHYGQVKEIPKGTPAQEFPRVNVAMLRAEKVSWLPCGL